MSDIQNELDQHIRDVEFYEIHYQELLTQYPDQWVAILDQQVVGASDDAFDLVAQLKANGISMDRILTQHMTEDPEPLIC